MTTPLVLRPFEDRDMPLVESWLRQDHVRPWYQDPNAWLLELRERHGAFSFLRHFIVEAHGSPIGFCQYYACADADEEDYRALPREGTYSIDYLIGDNRFLGRGLGRAIVRTLAETIFSLPDARRIAVKPDPENLASRNALLSAGFIHDGPSDLFLLRKTQPTTPA